MFLIQYWDYRRDYRPTFLDENSSQINSILSYSPILSRKDYLVFSAVFLAWSAAALEANSSSWTDQIGLPGFILGEFILFVENMFIVFLQVLSLDLLSLAILARRRKNYSNPDLFLLFYCIFRKICC